MVPEVAAMLAARQLPAQEYMDFFAYLWDRCDRNTAPRTRVQLAPANLHWCSDDALMLQKEYARRYGVGLHMHLLETPYQKEYARRRTGTTAVRHLDNLGFLGPDVTLGHGVWLTEDDIDLVAARGVMICHNASSNLRLRSGTMPLNPLTRRGIRVAIGIDEAGINDDRDMLQEMRLALDLHRTPGMGAGVPTAPQVLQMATEHGALTTGFGDAIGTLAPGKAADLVLMRWDHVAYPYLDRDVPIVDAVLQRGRPGDVETVMVAGEVLYHDGHFTRVDKEAALRELAASLAVPPRPDEVHRRELASALTPYVKSVYDGWLDRDTLGEPFYTLNARR
jgi:5-methylthioadenosine/S-adenosylhomocysteine deaminase